MWMLRFIGEARGGQVSGFVEAFLLEKGIRRRVGQVATLIIVGASEKLIERVVVDSTES